jgi:hypothetical protein
MDDEKKEKTRWIEVRCSGCGHRYIRSDKNTHSSPCCHRDMVFVKESSPPSEVLGI